MKKDVYVVVGQYTDGQEAKSIVQKNLVNYLKQLGEVNIFDMPTANSEDSGEINGNIVVHRYACPERSVANIEQRIPEIVRDLVQLGAKEYYLDYSVEKEYLSAIKLINRALQNYGVKVYTFNRHVLFRWLRKLMWNIKFQLNEMKLQDMEDQELQHIEGYTGHTMSGFAYYQKVEKARAERKRLHQEFLKSIK